MINILEKTHSQKNVLFVTKIILRARKLKPSSQICKKASFLRKKGKQFTGIARLVSDISLIYQEQAEATSGSGLMWSSGAWLG